MPEQTSHKTISLGTLVDMNFIPFDMYRDEQLWRNHIGEVKVKREKAGTYEIEHFLDYATRRVYLAKFEQYLKEG